MAVAVGGRGLGGGAVAGRVAVPVGGRGVCVGEGTGAVSVGAAVAVGTGGLGVAVASAGAADGNEVAGNRIKKGKKIEHVNTLHGAKTISG